MRFHPLTYCTSSKMKAITARATNCSAELMREAAQFKAKVDLDFNA